MRRNRPLLSTIVCVSHEKKYQLHFYVLIIKKKTILFLLLKFPNKLNRHLLHFRSLFAQKLAI